MKAGRNPRRAYDSAGNEIAPMTLTNMRSLGVTSVSAECLRPRCGHEAVVDASGFPAQTAVPDVGLRLRCTKCGGRSVATRPEWTESLISQRLFPGHG